VADLKCKDVSVNVVLDLNHDPEFYFQTSLPMKGSDHLKFHKGKKDGFLISFNLQDPDNVYSFGNNLSEALYSHSQASCPTGPGQWAEFTAQEITNGGMTLVVHNANSTVQDFGYTLRITRDGGATYKELDPIGTNSNSNLRISTGAAATYTAVGGAIGYAATQLSMSNVTTATALMGALVGAVIGLSAYLVTQNLGRQAA
jgi:hypothetical protein